MVNRNGDSSLVLGVTRQLLAALPERVLLCDAAGTILQASGAAEALLGREAAQLEGMPVVEVVPVRFHAVEGRPLLEHLRGKAGGGSLRAAVVHRRGVEIEVDLIAAPMRAAGAGDWLFLYLRQVPEQAIRDRLDDTERVQAEIYRLVFEGAPEGIFHFDERGVITACNEPFVRLIGSSRQVLIGLDMTTLPFRPMADAVRRALGGEHTRYEGLYPSATAQKETQVRVLFAPIRGDQGAVVGGVAIAEDVTERAQAEQTLRRSFESFRTLIDRAPDAIAVHRGMRFLLVNPSLTRMLGYAGAEELLDVPLLDVIHERDRVTTASLVADLELGTTGPSRELRFLRKDGATILTEVASMPVHFEDAPAILTLARDVTERKQLEGRLAQADRMASVGTLAAGVAHEINNPLTYILGNLDLLEMSLANREVADQAGRPLINLVKEALEGCERVQRIVQDLLTFTRAGAERVGPVDLRAVIESALELANVKIRHRARVERHLGPVPMFLGDAHRLGQVVLNLLLNAAQAIPSGEPQGHAIRVGTQVEGDRVCLSIEDDGSGMPPEVLAHLFEPFFTTKPVGVGTGLGLSICQGIVQSHGGSIQVESEVGRGSTFRVWLPLREALREPVAEGAPAKPVGVSPARIVLIDDETQLGLVLRSALTPHEVLLASSGREGLRLLLEAESTDLILCDLMMPDVTGIGVFEALRHERPELCERFVFMTGGVFPDQRIVTLAGPHAMRLQKPFGKKEVEQLLARVEQTARRNISSTLR